MNFETLWYGDVFYRKRPGTTKDELYYFYFKTGCFYFKNDLQGAVNNYRITANM